MEEILVTDIEKCEDILKKCDKIKATSFIREFVGSYIEIFGKTKIYSGLNYGGIVSRSYNYYSNSLEDLKKIKKRLEIKLALIEKEKLKQKKPAIVVNNTNTNDNTNNNDNNNTLNLTINFEKVRKEIENIETLNIEKIDEILKKIDEIQDISLSSESKNRKWGKLKGHFNWLSTNGVDIAVKILPLILKTINNDG